MKKIKLLALMAMMSIGCQAQVTYFETNNFLLNYFTNSGFLAYDWRFEPQKTDVERGNLKGAPTKIVTNITDNTGRGFGVHFTDTTYYNAQGNIAKVVALKKDEINPKNTFRPDVYLYQYNAQGQLTNWTWFSETDNMDGHHFVKHVHDIVRNNQGQANKEVYKAYTQKGNSWEKFGDDEPWIFTYDANGTLTGGTFNNANMQLTYKNGQLIKLQEGNNKPIAITYDAAGRLTSFKYFMIDGMDIDLRRARRHQQGSQDPVDLQQQMGKAQTDRGRNLYNGLHLRPPRQLDQSHRLLQNGQAAPSHRLCHQSRHQLLTSLTDGSCKYIS